MSAPRVPPGPKELGIPDAAYAAGARAIQRYLGEDMTELRAHVAAAYVLDAAVPLDRACELRRLAAELEVTQREMRKIGGYGFRAAGFGEAVRALRAHADGLDSGAS